MFQYTKYQILIVVVFLFLSCGKKEAERKIEKETELKPKIGGTLICGKSGDAVSLDPAQADDGESITVCQNMYDALVRFNPGTIEIEPALAKSWSVSQDGLKYTFHLRKAVKFHDGTPLDADAVIFNFERQMNPKHPYHKINSGYIYWDNLAMNELIKSVHSENDSTVTITLKKVDATFFSILTMSFLYIASPQAIMKYKEKFSENPVGTGPFKFVKWEKGNDVTLSANTEYWDGRPFIDTLIFRPVLDNSLRLAFFREGQIDILNVLNPIDIPTIQNDKNVKLFQQFGMDIACLAMNNSHKPFDDVRVRLAVYHAIDRNKIIDQAYYGFARISKNPIPPMLLGYNENIQDYIYNPERAKQLLKEAGYKKIGKVKFFVPPIARPYLPNPQIVAEIIKNSLKNIGIEVEIISPEWRYYMRQLSKGEHNMALAGWIADIPDSDNFFSSLLNKATLNKLESNNNWTFYKSDKMYELIVKGKTAIDERERSEIYRQACEVFHQDVPWIPLAHSTVVIPMLQSVMDFKPGLAREMKFDKTWINK